MTDPQRLLRNSLRGNAAFSTLSGLVFTFGASSVSQAIGLAEPAILIAVGVGLLCFAGLLVHAASRPTLDLPQAMLVVGADLAWVAGTLPVVLLGLLNRTGTVAAIGVADVVLVFALLQYLGVRRIRGGVATAQTAGA